MAKPQVKPDISSHMVGTQKGEERVRRHGREPGRTQGKGVRTARDATSINPSARDPIDPRMPHLPPP